MIKRIPLLALVLLTSSCMKVVETTTTSEIRPMRYAILEFTPQLAAPDSALAYARRALAAENIKLIPGEASSAVVEGGPVHFDAAGELPALDANIAINAVTQGTATKFRVYASAVMPAGAVGGVDPRLMQLVERISRHIESMIAR